MPFKIVRDDITKIEADAIVNTANPNPVYGAGTDSAIYQAAGVEPMLAERKKIGKIERGQVAVTPGFALPARYVIHTVGPVWIDGRHGELKVLADCYENSLAKAGELGCKSIAFPLISTGSYGFPVDQALHTAVSVISRFLMESDMWVILAVFGQRAFEMSEKLFADVDAFIDKNYVDQKRKEEYPERGKHLRRSSETDMMAAPVVSYAQADASVMMPPKSGKPQPPMSLDDMLGQMGETFQQRLLRLIDERGMTDVEVYKRANLDRKLFSKIRGNENYKPSKKTALALAIALELNVSDTTDLLERAGLALSPSSKSDLIILYYISRGEYNIMEIDLALYAHDEPCFSD